MTIETVRNALMWCTIINYGILILWVILCFLPNEWFYRLCARWYKVTEQQFHGINLLALAFYKLGIILFSLVPWIALTIVR